MGKQRGHSYERYIQTFHESGPILFPKGDSALNLSGPIKEDDALIELRAGTEQGEFDILLVSEFARIGRVPLECSFAGAFFERSGVEVWDTVNGHIGLFVRN